MLKTVIQRHPHQQLAPAGRPRWVEVLVLFAATFPCINSANGNSGSADPSSQSTSVGTPSAISGMTNKIQGAYEPVREQENQAAIPEIDMFVGESRVFPAPGVARIAVGSGQWADLNRICTG